MIATQVEGKKIYDSGLVSSVVGDLGRVSAKYLQNVSKPEERTMSWSGKCLELH